MSDEEIIKKTFQDILNLKDDEINLLFTLIDTGLINQADLLGQLKDNFKDDSWDESKVNRIVKELKNKSLIWDYNRHPQKKLRVSGFNQLYEEIIEQYQNRLNILKDNRDEYNTTWELGSDEKEIDTIQIFSSLHFIKTDLRNLSPIEFIGFYGRKDVFERIVDHIPNKYRDKIEIINNKLFSVLIAKGAKQKSFVYEFEVNPHRRYKEIEGIRFNNPARYKHFYKEYFENRT